MSSSSSDNMDVVPTNADSTNSNDNNNTVEEVVIDEYQVAFDALEEDANTVLKGSNTVLIQKYEELLGSTSRSDDIVVKIKEKCIYQLARLHTESKNVSSIMSILQTNNDFFSVIPKARTAKIVRNILNIVDNIPDSSDIQITLCMDVIEWCVAEKRTFLRQRIEAKLANLLLLKKNTTKALDIINALLKELKKLDDKQMLTEAHLTEARIYHSLQNIPKSKASLTASRTAANAIYVIPTLQAELDEMSGILHCEECDYTTSYSYFLEAFDAYDQANDKNALKCLKYMVLSKVLADASNEVPSLLSGRFGMKHAGPEIDAMASIAVAAKARSLEDFKQIVSKNAIYLTTDDLISHHLDLLYDKMLESNLLKIIHPYSCVELSHVAKLINLPLEQVERKMSQMILDNRFSGILDQGKGHLIIYDAVSKDITFTSGMEIISNIGVVVEALSQRASSLQASKATKIA